MPQDGDIAAVVSTAAQDIGGFIRSQREIAQVSVRQLAEKAGVSNPYLSQIERGLRKPSAEVLNQIAKAFAPMGEARAVPKVAEHIKAFWDPRMRRKIDELERLGKIGVPDQRAVANFKIVERIVNFVDPLLPLFERLAGAENRAIFLHDLLHLQAKLGCRCRSN